MLQTATIAARFMACEIAQRNPGSIDRKSGMFRMVDAFSFVVLCRKGVERLTREVPPQCLS
jgi:hypothetical protein